MLITSPMENGEMTGQDGFHRLAEVGRRAPAFLRHDALGEQLVVFSFTPDVMSVAMMQGRRSISCAFGGHADGPELGGAWRGPRLGNAIFAAVDRRGIGGKRAADEDPGLYPVESREAPGFSQYL